MRATTVTVAKTPRNCWLSPPWLLGTPDPAADFICHARPLKKLARLAKEDNHELPTSTERLSHSRAGGPASREVRNASVLCRHLNKWRVAGGGPPFQRQGRRIIYPRLQYEDWLLKRLTKQVRATSEFTVDVDW
jgi:hypothetical protein